MKQRATVPAGTSELSEDEVVSTSSIQLNEELVMLMMARSSRATKCTARRGERAVGCPWFRGTFHGGRSVGHTHTLEEEGEGPPSLSGTNRQRQPGGAPAQAGAQDGSPAEHGQARGGGVTTPQKAGLAPKEEGGISRSPTSSQQVLTQAHRMPDSPKRQQPPPARRARPRPAAKKEEVVARAVAVVLSSGGGFGTACEDDGRRRLEAAAAAPPAAPLAHLEEAAAVVVVIPEGGGGKPPPPLRQYTCAQTDITNTGVAKNPAVPEASEQRAAIQTQKW